MVVKMEASSISWKSFEEEGKRREGERQKESLLWGHGLYPKLTVYHSRCFNKQEDG